MTKLLSRNISINNVNKIDKYHELNDSLKLFFEYQIKLKILCFQTNSFTMHKIIKNYLLILEDDISEFTEIMRFSRQKITIGNIKTEIQINTINDNGIIDDIKKFISSIERFNYNNDTALLNIRKKIIIDAKILLKKLIPK